MNEYFYKDLSLMMMKACYAVHCYLGPGLSESVYEKAVKELTSLMDAQLILYLKVSKLKVGYLVNFNGTSVKYKRLLNIKECFIS
jgi:hypothetical protein